MVFIDILENINDELIFCRSQKKGEVIMPKKKITDEKIIKTPPIKKKISIKKKTSENEKIFKTPPPFVTNKPADIPKLISILKDMDFEYVQHKEDNAIIIQCGLELQIVIEDNNKIFLTMWSLMCPKKVFDLSLRLFKNNIQIFSYAIIHQLPSGELLDGEDACNGRYALLDFIHNIPSRSGKKQSIN